MLKSNLLLMSCLLLVSCSGSKGSGVKYMGSMTPDTKTDGIAKSEEADFQTEFQKPESRELRSKYYKELLHGRSVSNLHFDTKVKNALTYLNTFKFELWTGSLTAQSQAQRESLFLDASHEFLERMMDLTRRFKMSKISPLYDVRNQGDEFAFYAVSVAMQRDLLKVIERTLKADHERVGVESQNQIFIQGEGREITIGLIEARIDVLSALALKLLTNNAKSNFGQGIEGFVASASFSHLKHLDIPELLTQEDQIFALLKAAKQSRDFLKSIGISHALEKNLKSSFRHVDEKETREDINKLIQELL